MSATTFTFWPLSPAEAKRQARYRHLCALLGVQDRPDSGDGYTADDWAARVAVDRAQDAARLER